MIVEMTNKNEVLTAIDESVAQLLDLASSLDETKFNIIPYKDSWTAGQLMRHVTKSTNGIAKAMRAESKPADRDPGKKIPELKKAFLDFSSKMSSPEFIVPEPGPYEKKATINEFNNSFERMKENTQRASLNDVVEGLPFGNITKLELLHFVLYHTQRHIHQMKKILDALKNI